MAAGWLSKAQRLGSVSSNHFKNCAVPDLGPLGQRPLAGSMIIRPNMRTCSRSRLRRPGGTRAWARSAARSPPTFLSFRALAHIHTLPTSRSRCRAACVRGAGGRPRGRPRGRRHLILVKSKAYLNHTDRTDPREGKGVAVGRSRTRGTLPLMCANQIIPCQPVRLPATICN